MVYFTYILAGDSGEAGILPSIVFAKAGIQGQKMPYSSTLASRQRALASLRSTETALSDTQRRISSGLRVEKASDNAAYWSMATTMRSDIRSMDAIQDGLGMSQAIIDTAALGTAKVLERLTAIKGLLLAAREPGSDRAKLNLQMEQEKLGITAIVKSSSVGDQNWLEGSQDVSVQTAFLPLAAVRGKNGSYSIKSIEIDRSLIAIADYGNTFNGFGGPLTGTLMVDEPSGAGTVAKFYTLIKTDYNGSGSVFMTLGNSTTNDNIEGMLMAMDQMTNYAMDSATTLGAISQRLQMQMESNMKFIAAATKGVGRLVDADMGTESVRIKALQVRQELGIAALSIINQKPALLLQLFR